MAARSWRSVPLLVSAAGVCVVAVAGAENNDNWVVNGDAETGTMAPWEAGGWTSVVAQRPPGTYESAGRYFSAATPDTAMSQEVPVPTKYDQEIDSGQFDLYFDALLGGTGSPSVGAALRVQPLDGSGAPIGAAMEVGPPSASDRTGSAFLDCGTSFRAPPGMRSVSVKVQVTGNADANDLALADNVYVGTAIASGTSPYVEPAESPRCVRGGDPTPTATETPSPTATALVSPTATPRRSRLGISHVSLRHRRLAFRFETGAAVRVLIARRGMVVREFVVTKSGRRVTRRFGRLPDGRYRIVFAPGTETSGRAFRVERRLR